MQGDDANTAESTAKEEGSGALPLARARTKKGPVMICTPCAKAPIGTSITEVIRLTDVVARVSKEV